MQSNGENAARKSGSTRSGGMHGSGLAVSPLKEKLGDAARLATRLRARAARAPVYSAAITRACTWVLVVGLVCIGMGLSVYRSSVLPLERKLFSEEVLALAERIDQAVELRHAVVGMAATELDVDNLQKAGGLDRVRKGLRRAFPDFLTMEVLNDQGEILAMVGDINATDLGRSSGSSVWEEVEAAAGPSGPIFQDDSARGYFYLIGKHAAKDGSAWYSRARFSRQAIDGVLSPPSENLKAHLISASPSADGKKRDQAPVLAVKTDWLGRPSVGEAPVIAPGWRIQVEKAGGAPLPLSIKAMIALTIVVIIALIWLLGRWTRSSAHSQGEQPAEVSAVQSSDEWSGSRDQTPEESWAAVAPEKAAEIGFTPFERPAATASQQTEKDCGRAAAEPARAISAAAICPPPRIPRDDGRLDELLASHAFMEEFSEAPEFRLEAPRAAIETSRHAHASRTPAAIPQPRTGFRAELPETLEVSWEKSASAQLTKRVFREEETLTVEVAGEPVPEFLDLAWEEPQRSRPVRVTRYAQSAPSG